MTVIDGLPAAEKDVSPMLPTECVCVAYDQVIWWV